MAFSILEKLSLMYLDKIKLRGFDIFYIKQWFETRGILPSWGHLAMPRDNFSFHNWRWKLLVASNGQRPGMLLNTPQGTRQSPTTKNYQVQYADSANVQKHYSKLTVW